MAEPLTIARPYAEAAFDLARDANALPVWSEMLRLAADVAADERMHAALASPKLTAGDKEALFLSICGERLSPEGRNFVRVLIEAERIDLLPQIRELFEERKNDVEGTAKARIESAFPLDAGELASLTTALEKRFGRKIEATVDVNPSLLGGARISVGDTVIDGSVAGKLVLMGQQLRA